MRRSASEILRNLERRIARLEKSSSERDLKALPSSWLKDQMRNTNLKAQMSSWERTQSKARFIDWVDFVKDPYGVDHQLFAKYSVEGGEIYVGFQTDEDNDWAWTHTVLSSDWAKGHRH